MHLQITHQYMKYKSLKYSCSIHIIYFSNNNKTKGCDLHSFSQLPLRMSISDCSK